MVQKAPYKAKTSFDAGSYYCPYIPPSFGMITYPITSFTYDKDRQELHLDIADGIMLPPIRSFQIQGLSKTVQFGYLGKYLVDNKGLDHGKVASFVFGHPIGEVLNGQISVFLDTPMYKAHHRSTLKWVIGNM